MKLPPQILDIIDRHSTEDTAGTIKEEISNVVDSIPFALQITPALEHGRTHGDWVLNIDGNELRPGSALSWPIIDSMEKSALPSFAILMKLAPILSVFRSWQGIIVKCPSDEELAEVVSENMRQVLPLMAMEFGFRSMIDGVCFMETRYKNTTKYLLGLSKTRLPSKQFTVASHPHVVDARTVLEIKRIKGTRKFNGFIQQDPLEPHSKIPVSPEQSLVIPHNERFRNLWGVSALTPMYEPWFWTQVLMRSIVRWAERIAVPTAMGSAPMFDTIPDPTDTTTTIKALDYMVSVASSLSRSQYAIIPSDVDPESGKPKYTLGYESSGDGGVSTALSAILQEFTQMTIRAAISADRATTQSSGGVGSYAIGSIHDQATQFHNQMILTSWISYLNKYWLPWFSFYTRGVNGPPIRLEVATVDPSYRDLLNQMLGTMGNTKPGQDALWLLDYPTLLNLAHVPTLDPEEAQKLREKSEEEAMDRADEAMKRQQALAPPPEAAEGRREQAAKDKANEVIKKVEAAADEIKQIMDVGGNVPICVGLDQVTELIKEARRPIQLQDPDFDESKVSRDPGGRFASKSSAARKIWDAIQSDAKKILETALKVGDRENAKKLLEGYGLTDAEMEDALKILENSRKYSSIDDAFNDISQSLIDGGYADKEDIDKIRAVFFKNLAFEGGAIGIFDVEQKELMMNEEVAIMLLSGDPLATAVMAHEILHASALDFPEDYEPSSEFQEFTASIGMPTNANSAKEYEPIVGFTEGRNDLARALFTNEQYGTNGITTNSIASKAASAALLNLTPEQAEEYIGYNFSGYVDEVNTIAQLAIIIDQNSMTTAHDWVIESNKIGDNSVVFENELRAIFPERMSEYGTMEDGSYRFPDIGTVSTWATEDYGVERDGSIEYIIGTPETIENIDAGFPVGLSRGELLSGKMLEALRSIHKYMFETRERILNGLKAGEKKNVGREDKAADSTESE